MQIQERQVGDVTVFELTGRLTVNDQPGVLREAVADAVRRGTRDVLLDLAGVHYIDSTKLGELIAAHVSLTRQGGTLKLIRTPGKIVELLTMAGLDGVFRRYDSIDQARSSAGPS